jgi:hypothetical protein
LGCGLPFFPRVLEHLVGLGVCVRQAGAGQPYPGDVLQPMPQVQQVAAATAQLAGQLGRGRALGDAAEEEHDLGRGALGALQGGAGPGVEDPAAARTAVVEDGVAVGAMDGQAMVVAVGTGEAAGVQRLNEEVVAGLFVQQFNQGKVHGRPPTGPRGLFPGVLALSR